MKNRLVMWLKRHLDLVLTEQSLSLAVRAIDGLTAFRDEAAAGIARQATKIYVLELENKALLARFDALDALRIIADQPKRQHTPFRVNGQPGRKQRMELERQHDPEFQRQEQLRRDAIAKQPIQGATNA